MIKSVKSQPIINKFNKSQKKIFFDEAVFTVELSVEFPHFFPALAWSVRLCTVAGQ